MFTLFLDQCFPFGNNPRNVRLLVIGHELGALCAVWASHEQEAFDEACNAGVLDCLMSEEQDYDDESLAALGDASELFDLSNTWIAPVEWQAERDIKLILAMVRAVENQERALDNKE